jgi:hypothetical protein
MPNGPANPGDDKVNELLQRHQLDQTLPMRPPGTDAQSAGLSTPEGDRAKAEGMVASFKAGRIQRKAAVAFLNEFYDRQLEAAKHHLSEAVRIRRAQSTQAAEQFLQLINSQHVDFLNQIGLRNFRAAGDALTELAKTTHDLLQQVASANLPDMLAQDTVESILARYKRFRDKLTQELGEN